MVPFEQGDIAPDEEDLASRRPWQFQRQTVPSAERFKRTRLHQSKVSVPDVSENHAFMFLKPHANTEAGRCFLEQMIKDQGIEVLKEGEIPAEVLDSQKIIDAHYGSLAKKALETSPRELLVKSEARDAFREAFGLTWDEALDQGLVLNSSEAMERLGLSGEALEEIWAPLRFGEGKVKLAGGCYVGLLRGIFVINGFYLGMRAMYTKPDTSVHWYMVKFSAAKQSWADFRKDVLGHTDPTLSSPTSLRGLFLEKWRELGLPREPHVGENAVHASASPLEAIAERRNWLQGMMNIFDDPFFAQLISKNVPIEKVEYWLTDPKLKCEGGRAVSAFDVFEDHNTEECLELAQRLVMEQD